MLTNGLMIRVKLGGREEKEVDKENILDEKNTLRH